MSEEGGGEVAVRSEFEGEIENAPGMDKVSQEQIHGLLFGQKLSWQAIIYDLINSERLDPWDIDLVLLVNKYLEKVRTLEEANFFVSSKVLFAAALLLRIKSEILLDIDIKSLDDLLFGKKEERKYVQERIDLDEEIPGLVPRTPLPRFRKVTLQELMAALGKAIMTENRRIKRVVIARQQEFETALSLPRRTINVQDEIKNVHSKLREIFENRDEKLAFSEFAGMTKDERIATFIPLLHLDNQQKVWLEQDGHLQEIWILLKHLYEKQNAPLLMQWEKEVEEELVKIKEEERIMEEEEKNNKSKKGRFKKKEDIEEVGEFENDAEINEPEGKDFFDTKTIENKEDINL